MMKYKQIILLMFLCYWIQSCSYDSSKSKAERPASVILKANEKRALTNIKYESTPERLVQGEYLTSALRCLRCHSPKDQAKPGWPAKIDSLGAGTVRFKTDSTYVYARNITSDIQTGLGNLSDDMIGRAIREGIGHDDRVLSGMPSGFQNLTDEDLAAIVVYLRTLPAIKNKTPPRNLGKQKEERLQNSKYRPLDKLKPTVVFDQVLRGKYLINLTNCKSCHSGNFKDRPEYFGGGRSLSISGNGAISSNITSDQTGIGGWSETAFINVMKNGKGKGGNLDPDMPWTSYNTMTNEDLAAIYQALMTTYPVKHLVINSAPPSYCKVCGNEHGMGNVNEIEQINPFNDSGSISELVGDYKSQFVNGRTISVRFEDQSLFLNKRKLIPLKKDNYETTGYPAGIQFNRNQDGQVTGLIFQDLRLETFLKTNNP